MTSILASSTKHATVQTLHYANKLIRKLKPEEVTLRFQHLGKDSSLKMVVFSDSSYGKLSRRRHIRWTPDHADGREWKILTDMLAVKEDEGSCLEHFSRRNVGTCTDSIDSAVFLATLYSELTTGDCTQNNLPIVCVTDNHNTAVCLTPRRWS